MVSKSIRVESKCVKVPKSSRCVEIIRPSKLTRRRVVDCARGAVGDGRSRRTLRLETCIRVD